MAPPADKKSDKKDAPPPGWNLDTTEALIVGIFFLAILSTIVPAIIGFIRNGELSFFGLEFSSIINFFKCILHDPVCPSFYPVERPFIAKPVLHPLKI